VQPPTDHFKKLFEETCPNRVYPVKHKLKDCDMMKSFMISGSPTQGAELGENLGGSDTMPFIGENAIMTVYGGRPPPGWHRMSKMSSGPDPCCKKSLGTQLSNVFIKLEKLHT
jgi:hypothetical protein